MNFYVVVFFSGLVLLIMLGKHDYHIIVMKIL